MQALRRRTVAWMANAALRLTGPPYGKPAFVRKTDLLRKGRADVPWAIQPTQWVSVEKPGYESVGNIDVNQPKPITVKLKRQGPPTPER